MSVPDPLPSFGYDFTFPYTCHSPSSTITPKLTVEYLYLNKMILCRHQDKAHESKN